MLVALLISMTLPAVLSSLGNATLEMNDRKLASIAEHLARTVEEMAAAGPGNVRVVHMPGDLPAGARVLIGGAENTSECHRLSWGQVDDELGSTYLNGVFVLTEDGRPLRLGSGDVLRLSCPLHTWDEVRAELI